MNEYQIPDIDKWARNFLKALIQGENIHGGEIKTLRKILHLTQQQLAVKLSVSLATIYRWEKDKSQPSPLAQQNLRELLEETNDPGTSKKGRADKKDTSK